MITLYTAATPNGYKASITLEEMGLAYDCKVLKLGENEQKQSWFRLINPNGRIPAIVDHDAGDFSVFESGAIMLYLAEKTGILWPKDLKARSQMVQWLMFQMGGVGPMQGQTHVFLRYFPEKIPSVIARYQNETRRLYGVLNERLTQVPYLTGDYSLADIANWCWVKSHAWAGIELDDLPALADWVARIAERPAVQRGLQNPPRTDTTSKAESDKLIKSAQAMLQT